MVILNMPFERWYIGLFLIGLGVYLVVRARALNDLRRYFRRDDCSPGLEEAVARRQELEALPLAAWYVPGIIDVLLGAAVLAAGSRCGRRIEGLGLADGVGGPGVFARGIEDMGQTIYAALTYYEKWAMCAANVLVTKGHFTPDELAQKIAQVKRRFEDGT